MRLFLFALALLFVTPLPAKAQDQATVVASCGSVTLTAGTQHFRTIDTNGVTCSSGGGGAAPTSVWSSSDATANGMTLTNGGLTVSNAVQLSGSRSIRNTISKSSGKVYVEFLGNSVSAAYAVAGVASSSFDPTVLLGNSAYSASVYSGAQNFVSAGFTSNYTSGNAPNPSGDVWALAVDFTSGNIWFAVNNVWVNSSNPATGSLPIISFVPATVGPLFAGITMNSGIALATWTLQSTAAALKYAPPSGFKAWDAP